MRDKINVIDIETFGEENPVPYCMAMVYKDKKFTCYGLSCIRVGLNWIFENCKNETIFFAHNLNFDGCVLINNLPENIGLNAEDTVLKDGNIYNLCLEKGGVKRIKFRCSYKILPLSLKNIAQALGLPEKLEISHEKIDETNYLDEKIKKVSSRYCERDVKICHLFLQKVALSLLKDYEIWKGYKYSISGISWSIFVKKYWKKDFALRLSVGEDSMVRPAYYGGRCEVFGNTEDGEKTYHFDFKSMYTRQLKKKFPKGKFNLVTKINKIKKPGFYSINVISKMETPVLPYRDANGKLFFPNGKFSGLYWYEEIELFTKKGGRVEKINWGLEFEEEGYLFEEFAEKCLERRKEDLASDIMWKLVPNTFIGRLGIRPSYEKTIIIDEKNYDPTDIRVIGDRKIGKTYIVKMKDFDSDLKSSGNVVFPAIVASKARIEWYESAEEVIKGGGRLLYCDTDSIFAAFKKDVKGERHGSVEWDNSTILESCFAGAKIYSLKYEKNTKVVIKGIPKKKIDLDFEKFKRLFLEQKKKNFRNYEFINSFFEIKIEEIEKSIDFGGYDKRIFNDKKTRTQAVEIYENTLYKDRQEKTTRDMV